MSTEKLTIALLVLAACSGSTTCRLTSPTPSPTRPPSCEDACARLDELDCPAAKPTPNGASCAEVCTNAEKSGLALWGLSCIVTAPSCIAADACGGAP